MSEQVKIGKLIEGEAGRDAVHIAIAPVTAGEDGLEPGTRIGFSEPGCEIVRARRDGPGIVDPFLPAAPKNGQRFYMCLLPGTILSLRHHWSHPAFPRQEPEMPAAAFAEEWLKSYALRVRPYDSDHGRDYAYQKFMKDVAGGSIFYYGSDLHGAGEVEQAGELYRYLSIVLGREVSSGDFTFSCSC